jgi:pyruvate,water dikinase
MIGIAEDPIIKRSIGRKQTQIVYTRDGSDKRTKTILTPDADAAKRCFSDEDARKIAEWCLKIEDHYSKHHGHSTPMDIEWAKDGVTGDLFIVQARPETGKSEQEEIDFVQIL